MPTTSFQLLIPHLLWPEPAATMAFENLPLPALETLLARAKFQRNPAAPFEFALARVFGRSAEAPLAAFRLLGEEDTSDAGDGHWLCADPVHLKVHQDRLILADPGVLHLSAQEARQLVEALNAEFRHLGKFRFGAPERWYLRLPEAGALVGFPPLTAMAGRSVAGCTAAGGDNAEVQRWLNEVQMFLHHHPVNVARSEAGLPTVNSLWLWGGGRPANATRERHRYFGVWTDNPLVAGLAHADCVPVHPLPADFGRVVKHAAPGSRHLVVIDTPLHPALYEDMHDWRQALTRLEADWFQPLLALGGEWSIQAPTAYGDLRWESGGMDRFKLWRRPRPLSALIPELAA